MPADEIVKGFNGFTEQPRRRTKKRGGQWVTTRTFKGPQALTESKEDELLLNNPLSISTELGVPANIEIETEDGGGTIEIGSQSERDSKALADAVWTLDWDRIETDIRDNSHFRYIGSATEMAFVETIDQALAKGTAHLTDWDAVTGVVGANKYMQAKIRGINSFIEFAPIMRCTITAQATTEIKVINTRAGRVVPWLDSPLPDGPYGVRIPEYPAVPTPTQAGFDQPKVHAFDGFWSDTLVDQWLVFPAVRSFNNSTQEVQFVYEWHGAVSYSGWLYDGGTGKPTA